MLSQRKQPTPYGIFLKVLIPTIGGGVVFWGATIATSLHSIAAEYRAAFSNWSIRTVWIDSLPAGLIISCCVAYTLLRLFERIPTRNPISKSLALSFIALVIATILIDVPRSLLLSEPSNALYYFLLGVMFNAARFLLLGLVIGYLYNKLYGSTRLQTIGNRWSGYSPFKGEKS